MIYQIDYRRAQPSTRGQTPAAQANRALRTAFVRLSERLPRPLSIAWSEVRRDPSRAQRWWGNLVRHLDEAIEAGAEEAELLTVPAAIAQFIHDGVERRSLRRVAVRRLREFRDADQAAVQQDGAA